MGNPSVTSRALDKVSEVEVFSAVWRGGGGREPALESGREQGRCREGEGRLAVRARGWGGGTE